MGFFQEGLDNSCFEAGQNIAGVEGEINDFGYEVTDGMTVSFKQRGDDGVKGACGWFGITDYFLDLLLHCGGQM